MLARELTKLGICTITGILLSFFLDAPQHMLLCILYAIGTVYSARIFLPKIWGAFCTGASTSFKALFSSGFFPMLFAILLAFGAIIVILSFAWIVGIVIAIISILRAVAEDRSIRLDDFPRPKKGSPSSEETDWDYDSPSNDTSRPTLPSSHNTSWDSEW